MTFCNWFIISRIWFLVILVYWLFDVTVDEISVIYMMAHRFAGGLKRPVLVLGLQKLFGS